LAVRVIGRPWFVHGERGNPVAWPLLPLVGRADVVHCHQQHVLASSLAAILCRLSQRRVFVSDLGGGGWDISAYLSTDRWYHGHLHLSEYSRRIYGHAGKPWARVIFGGVNTDKFSPDASVPRGETVLFVGRLLAHKGVDDLMNAVPPDLPLQVIGPVADAAYVQKLHSLASGKRVTFHHDCDDAGLVRAYRRALCVVLPSVYRTACGLETKVPELLGQTLLGGMACATPVVCTRVASLPEVVEDGVTGLVVPPNDPVALGRALAWLREHPESARAMGEAGRRRVLERFTWPTVVRRCLEIYAA
jgi:glycosyltransferase involved in cell wall biosynthesis